MILISDEMSCPLCSLSGVSYDEMSFHISTAHPENRGRAQELHCVSTSSSTPSSCSSAGTSSACIRDLSASSKRETASHSSAENCGPTKTNMSLRRSPPTPLMVELKQRRDVIPPSVRTTPVSGDSPSGTMASVTVVNSLALTERCHRTAKKLVGRSIDDDDDDKDKGAFTSEPHKVKQKRLSSSGAENQFPCPMCEVVCSNSFILQQHVELHMQEQNTAEGAKSYECPMCSVVFTDSFLLQEHVELHLDYGAATSCAGSSDSDLRLAKELQQKEEWRRREQEAKQEAVEFKKLQRQFGLDGSGGYRRQVERSMDKAVSRGLMTPAEFHSKMADMMESLASGSDDGKTRTQGMLEALSEYYQKQTRDCVHVWLSSETDHYCSSEGDKGWGCGYRNFQMLLSSIHQIDTFSQCLKERVIPSIPKVQCMIEEAWKEGLDPQGACHFNQRLQGTRAWIGATEIYALLISLGIRARIIDFHQPTGPGDTHPRLFEWVKQYFSQSLGSHRLPSRVIRTPQPPLYLQHKGHSRSIVGVEQKKNGSLCLLLLDPSCSSGDARKLFHQDGIKVALRHMRYFPSNLKHKQYQVVAIDGILSPEEKQICALNSRTLRAERVP
ncbi:zinc finger-containing ubiquitin peptidase 1 isoform X2 [Lampris incognitus]|uniref:zinc finger-containing ubiquitin peptidase 1 isoform X2 n=1 Tax=Lampris incognitus TaxID=2546036 RepID=UPI0024B62590|nr:zinc finger-containing ubiquitin peptidase 1 isoform X2 [Lampris incognitus]